MTETNGIRHLIILFAKKTLQFLMLKYTITMFLAKLIKQGFVLKVLIDLFLICQEFQILHCVSIVEF